MQNNKLGRIILALFIASVFLLAFTKISDTDTWMHMSIGKLILELKGFPEKDVFVYPASDRPFLYTSWLFAVIFYLINLVAGGAGLTIFKAVTFSAAFYILFKDSLRPHGNYFVSAVVLSVSVIAAASRFTMRPDMFLLIFLPFCIYSLNAYLYNEKKYIYFLPLVHLLWANMHSSVPLMFVPFGAFIAGGLINRYAIKGRDTAPSTAQLKTVFIVFAASFLATLLNPNFTGQYFYGSSLLQSGWFRSHIVELMPPAGLDRNVIFAADAIILLSFALNLKRLSFFHLLLVLPFMYLPFDSVRFILLLAIIGGPVVARNIAGFVKDRGWENYTFTKYAAVFASIWLVLYTSLSLADIRPFGNERSQFGAGFDYSEVPEGAVEYLDRNKISGRLLNAFDFGGYIIWKSYPKNTVFMDSRGDLPEKLRNKAENFRTSPDILDELYGTYGFEAILVKYPYTTLFVAQGGSHAYGGGETVYYPIKHPHWALVYWDDISVLLLRKTGKYGNIATRDEYQFIAPDKEPTDIFRELATPEKQKDISRELLRNINETNSSFGNALLGIIYNSEGMDKEAIETFKKVKKGSKIGGFDVEYTAFTLSGDSYMKLGRLDESLDSFQKALKLNKDAHYGLALFYKSTKNKEKAIEHFEKYLKIHKSGYYADMAKKQLKELSTMR